MITSPQLGQVVTCAETGKKFKITSDGFSSNFALDAAGNIFSDEGVNIREMRELLDRSKPFNCYLSMDGKHVTGWKGNVLGDVIRKSTVILTRISHTHGKYIYAVQVRDVHGGRWYGRGSPGICISLRPTKR